MAKTLKQLAQEAGVSIATVSKVVNGRDEHISEATRKRIRELVENSGYRPNCKRTEGKKDQYHRFCTS